LNSTRSVTSFRLTQQAHCAVFFNHPERGSFPERNGVPSHAPCGGGEKAKIMTGQTACVRVHINHVRNNRNHMIRKDEGQGGSQLRNQTWIPGRKSNTPVKNWHRLPVLERRQGQDHDQATSFFQDRNRDYNIEDSTFPRLVQAPTQAKHQIFTITSLLQGQTPTTR
jgi:hypothetical protein